MRTDKHLVVLIALVLCAITLNATGTDHYVDAISGSDATGDGSQGSPWKTLTYATNTTVGESPCVIHIAPGVYSPSANGETFPIVFLRGTGELRGSGSDVTIIDAEGTYRVMQLTLDNGTVSDLTITGGGHPTKNHNGGGISAYCAGGTIHLERCVVRDNYKGRGLDTGLTAGTYIITDCQFINNNGPDDGSGAGINIANFVTMTMTNCLVANNTTYDDPRFRGGGLFIASDTHVTLINCTIVNNIKDGVYMANFRSTVGIYNCILWRNNDDIRKNEAGNGHLTISHCNISDGDGLGENGNISQDPLFVTGAQGDYYLSHAGVNSKKKEKRK